MKHGTSTLNESYEKLLVDLTEDEVADRAQSLARSHQDVKAEEARQADVKAQMKATLAGLEATRDRLSLVVARKAESRDIRVRTIAMWDEGDAVTIREDTGEILRRRRLTDHERQQSLPVDDAASYAARRMRDLQGSRT